MRVIKPSFEILDNLNATQIYERIETIGRVCYKSEDRIAEGSAVQFVGNILNRGHESVIEHVTVSVRVICDRGVSHEIVRHRIASYSQESTRYCNYVMDKFGNELTFIKPCFWKEGSKEYERWEKMMKEIENSYFDLISMGASPQEARAILPNSLKTELIMTMNLREWRHFFRLRTSDRAHPQMREIADQMKEAFQEMLPLFFLDQEKEF